MLSKLLIALAVLPSILLTAQPAAIPKLSPPEQRIAAAQQRVKAEPKSAQSYNDLAFALCRLARDREDVTIYDRAQAALDQSFKIAKGNYEAEKWQAVIWLGKHQFADAMKLAEELNHKVPDDIAGWALLVDIDVALGNYSDAEHAAQWVLDLRSGSSLGFAKAAGLRELFGDTEGAIEFYNEANRRTSQSDADEHAWFLTQIARLNIASGNLKGAEDPLDQALALFPDSQLALANMARLRLAEADYPKAAALFEKHYQTVPSVANLYDWADAVDRAGQQARAATLFREFEAKARVQIDQPYNANRNLVFFYTDRKPNPAEALTIAERQSAVRHDSATLDAYAWALYRNGKYAEAKTQMDRALAVGVRDADYFCHAGQIAARIDDHAAQQKFAKELTSFSAAACPVQPLVQSASGASR